MNLLSDYEIAALLLSLKVSSVAVLFSLPFGIACAWILARCEFPGKSLFDSLIHLPLVLPPVVIGYILLISKAPAKPVIKYRTNAALTTHRD